MCWVSQSQTGEISDLGSAAEYGFFRREPGRDLRSLAFAYREVRMQGRKESKIQNRSDGFGECKSHDKEMV